MVENQFSNSYQGILKSRIFVTHCLILIHIRYLNLKIDDLMDFNLQIVLFIYVTLFLL